MVAFLSAYYLLYIVECLARFAGGGVARFISDKVANQQ